MQGFGRRVFELARCRGVLGLLRSGRWYITASRVPPPFDKRPDLLQRYLRFRRRLQPNKFTDADPFKILWVNPSRVEKAVRGHGVPLSFGRVKGGEWDERTTSFADRIVPRAIKARIHDNCTWSETVLYDHLMDAVNEGRVVYGCSSEAEIHTYFREIDRLAERIDTDGYRTQTELLVRDSDATWASTEEDRGGIHPRLNEVGINISRNGAFLWRHRGEHRLAIAQALDLDEVAVQVLTRHATWQQTRNDLRRGKETGITHPDLADIRPGTDECT